MWKYKILIILFTCISISVAQNYADILRYTGSENFSNARAAGMGNSVSTNGSDLSAILVNPAALGLVSRSLISFGSDFKTLDTKTNFFNTTISENKDRSNFGHFGFIAKMPASRGSFVVALSYDRINDFNKTVQFSGFNPGDNSMIKTLAYANDDLAYDLGLSYPYKVNGVYQYDDTKINGNLEQVGTTKEQGHIDQYAAAFSIELNRNFFFGVTANVYSGEYKQYRSYNEIDSRNYYGDDLLLDDEDERTRGFDRFELTDEVLQEVSGYSFTFGMLYKLNDAIKLSASLKTPQWLEIEERYRFRGKSYFINNEFDTFWEQSEVKFDVRTPYEVTIGAAFSKRNFTLSGDLTIIDYKKMKFTDGYTQNELDEKNLTIDENFRTVANLNLGGEVKIPRSPVKLRAGFIYKKSPYKDDNSKFDKKYITAGFGYAFNKHLILNIAYLYGWWEDVGDNYGNNISRTHQKIQKYNLVANLTMRL